MAKATNGRKVLFLDIDNCLYSRSTQIAQMMGDNIANYFRNHLGLTAEQAYTLHQQYYKDYGLAIQGLVAHHQVDALDFNAKVDDAIPLENILSRDPVLRKLLSDIDSAKVKLWLLTNAYIKHGQRVVRLLGVDDLFEGITYCDYAAQTFAAKPERKMFEKAMKEAEVERMQDCFFVDDAYSNAQAAQKLGWTAVHLVEPSVESPQTMAAKYQIQNLEELRTIFPEFFTVNRRETQRPEI